MTKRLVSFKLMTFDVDSLTNFYLSENRFRPFLTK